MSNPILGIVVFLALAFLVSIVWHYYLRHYALAIILSTITITVTFNCLAFISFGYTSTFLTMAVITTSAYSLIISVLVGLPLFVHRAVCKRKCSPDDECNKLFPS